MTTAAISTRDIRRSFGDLIAVDGVDLDVQRGEIYGFLGPNGAGKSTLVRMLCTLILPTSGKASVLGLDVVSDDDAIRRRIGVALQEAALDDNQSGRELLDIQGRLYGLTGSEIADRITQIGDLVDQGALDRRLGEYSGGMRRRLDLAACLLHSPELVFLDEPTTGLDPASRAAVWEEIRRLNESGTTIFLTTQYLEEADELADRVGIIAKGKLVAEDTPAVLKRQVGDDRVVVQLATDAGAIRAAHAVGAVPEVNGVDVNGCEMVVATAEGASAIGPIAVALDGADVKVEGLTMRTPTLDDVFLTLTGERTGYEADQHESDPTADGQPDAATNSGASSGRSQA